MHNKERAQAKGVSRVPVDRLRWSESSQRTYYDIQFYEDYTFTCRGCAQTFVLTAAEQKQLYEHEQRYIYWRPNLCEDCLQKRQAAADAAERYEAMWADDKTSLQEDPLFLKRWLDALERYAHLGGPRNDSVIQMLQTAIRTHH